MQTNEQLAAFRALCEANGLGKSDVWQHKQSQNWIIGRPGVEKIQGRNNIQIELELCAAAADFAVVKATATRTVKAEGKVAKKLSVQTLGSACAKNSQVTYYAEMAEKRAKGRSVLMLMGFYELGVYGEDEADEFSRAANPAPVEAPKKAEPEGELIGPGLATPVVPEAPVENAVELAREEDKKELIRLLNNPFIYGKEKNHTLVNMGRLTKQGFVAEQARLQGLITQRENERPVTTPATKYVTPAPEQQISALVKLLASPLLDAEERSTLLSMPLDQRPAAWVESTLAKLPAVLETRKDPKKALEAARNQLRTAAAKYRSGMPDTAYNALMQRAQALTARPEELRAEARAVAHQCQALAA